MEQLEQMGMAELGEHVMPYTEGLSRDDIVPFVRLGVRLACQETNMLNTLATFEEWPDGDRFELSHTGYTFNRVMAGWVRTPDRYHCRLDNEMLRNVERVDENLTVLTIPSKTDRFGFEGNVPREKVHIRYSLMPLIESDTFPRLLYEDYPYLMIAAVMRHMGPYTKVGNLQASSGMSWYEEYRREARAAKDRNSKGHYGSSHMRAVWDDAITYGLPPNIIY